MSNNLYSLEIFHRNFGMHSLLSQVNSFYVIIFIVSSWLMALAQLFDSKISNNNLVFSENLIFYSS